MKLRAALGAIALLGLLAGCGGPGKFADEAAPLTTSDAPSTSTPPSSTAGIVPTGIRIPSIAVNNRSFMQLGLVNKELEVPPLSQPKLMGWFKLSPLPGESALCSYTDGCVQPAVIASHVNGNGVAGGFAKLNQVKAGASIEVDRSDGKTAFFKVTKTTVFKKTGFDSKAVYGVSSPSIVLITCGPGTVVNGSYLNQTVVTASLVELKPTNP